MLDIDWNGRDIAYFTMLGHSLVPLFEISVTIFPLVWLAEFDVPVAQLGLIVAPDTRRSASGRCRPTF